MEYSEIAASSKVSQKLGVNSQCALTHVHHAMCGKNGAWGICLSFVPARVLVVTEHKT